MPIRFFVVSMSAAIALGACSPVALGPDGGTAGGSAAGGSAAGGSAAGGSTAGGSTAGGSTAGGSVAGGSVAGGSTAGGSAAGGSAAGGSAAGGSAAGGSAAGGSAAGGSAAGGSTAGGSTAGGSTSGGSTAGGSTAGGSTAGGSAAGGTATPMSVTVTLSRANGVTGTQRVNLGLPLADGIAPTTPIGVRVGGAVVATYSRSLATYPSGNTRSFQVQFDAPPTALSADLELGTTAPALTPAAVDSLLQDEPLGTAMVRTPRVWATLPASWLVTSTVAGRLVTNASLTTMPLNAWRLRCDHVGFGSSAFAPLMGTAGSWLYDRGTALYRGYVVTGGTGPLQSAYRETDLYRQRLLASSTTPPSTDLKYNYTQNLALHYLLTGDDRFREAAETIANRTTVSGYTGAISPSFWTERHAGFGLLANVYAARVSDDQAASFRTRADTILTNLVAIQNTPLSLSSAPAAKMLDATYRCFAHTPQAHDLSEYVNLDGAPATLVCSPWMSAIVAEGLEAWADDAPAPRRTLALEAIVRLGRRLVNPDNRNVSGGRPHYLLGIDGANAPDAWDEHWGEVAYVGAMAWHYSGRTDTTLRTNTMHYVTGFAADGVIGQLRSFNWQCRAAIATPYYLQ
ncbi:MAG: hypothetical protein JNJ54_27180 [Myxococcaceae bacterium]|nr:hypothetical protein [Myxococcaceae bacterium]